MEKNKQTRESTLFYDLSELLSLTKENISMFFDFYFPKLKLEFINQASKRKARSRFGS